MVSKPATFTWYEQDGRLEAIDFDVLVREGGQETSELTENPIERGAPVSDHAREKSDTLNLEVLVTNTPLRLPTSNIDGVTAGVGRDERTGATVLQFSSEFDRVASVITTLTRVRSEKLRWTIYTPLRVYENFLIDQVQTERTSRLGGGVKLLLSLKKLRTVQTRIVAIPPRRRRVAPTQPVGSQPTEPPRNSFFSGTARASGIPDTIGRFFRR